jgi:hypothetical protein
MRAALTAAAERETAETAKHWRDARECTEVEPPAPVVPSVPAAKAAELPDRASRVYGEQRSPEPAEMEWWRTKPMTPLAIR